MTNCAHIVEKPLAFCLILALVCLVACNQSNQADPPTAAMAASAGEKVFVVFEGPWAFVADPKDATMVLALAPKTKAHRDLNVSASNNSNLPAGTYELSVPAHGTPTTVALDPSFAQAKIDAKNLQKALDTKNGRYVVRLPKPEAYVAAKRIRSRVGPKYPPDASTEQNYVTSVSLRYTVSGLNGFSVAGTPDGGTFNPLLLQLDMPAIHFVIEPAQADDPLDKCSTHSREAFRDLVKFLGLTLYIDFPDDATDCAGKDPQKLANDTGRWPLLFVRQFASVLSEDPHQPISAAGISEMSVINRPLTNLFLFFHTSGAACRAPILFLTMS